MSCNFEEKCSNYEINCEECMYNPSGITLNQYKYNGLHNEPSPEEFNNYFETLCIGEAIECPFRDTCYNQHFSCHECMYDPNSITSDFFEFNGNGEEPSQEELEENIY